MTASGNGAKIRESDAPTTEIVSDNWGDELIVQFTSINSQAKRGNKIAYDLMCEFHGFYRERMLEMNQIISQATLVSGVIAARE